ncbi:MAG: VOC family protein [Proteobacteria bacterium]|nr:VOC family protein [Pseudomonadota bacterium]
MISRIDHVSIAVRDYEKARAFFQDILGAVPCVAATDNHLNFYWRIFALGDLTRLELVTPSAENSFLDRFLSDKAGGVHHVTVEVTDIRAFKDRLDRNEVPYFGYSEALGVWKELFIHPRDAFGVLIQVAEFQPEDYLADEVRFPKNGPRWSVEKSDGGCELTISHPGGGKAAMDLNREEIERLIQDLQEAVRK